MSFPIVGQIALFGFVGTPSGWIKCAGQLLAISQFRDLYDVIGTTYGGDGNSTFAVPDFRARVPMHIADGYPIGRDGGAEQVTLTNAQIPSHTHSASGTTQATASPAGAFTPVGNVLAQDSGTGIATYADQAPDQPMRNGNVEVIVENDGGGQPHNNMQPFLVVNFCIAYQGTMPTLEKD